MSIFKMAAVAKLPQETATQNVFLFRFFLPRRSHYSNKKQKQTSHY